jgi:putative transposase
MCRVLGLSTSGYYAWVKREPSARARRDEALRERIQTIYERNRSVYGRPRIHAELLEEGERIGGKRVARLMTELGIRGASRRRRKPGTTKRNADARPTPDLVERDFTADGPDQLWVADITYIPTCWPDGYRRNLGRRCYLCPPFGPSALERWCRCCIVDRIRSGALE